VDAAVSVDVAVGPAAVGLAVAVAGHAVANIVAGSR